MKRLGRNKEHVVNTDIFAFQEDLMIYNKTNTLTAEMLNETLGR